MVSLHQRTSEHEWMNVYKGFCSFPSPKKIDCLSLGFALCDFQHFLFAVECLFSVSFRGFGMSKRDVRDMLGLEKEDPALAPMKKTSKKKEKESSLKGESAIKGKVAVGKLAKKS